ncbi:MAG: class II fructose-1,6-bisphosphate aldolase [Geovibrio sp.]|nr:class II fructose-1,6-bisphosphate aldolase [Geovibrio sp.]
MLVNSKEICKKAYQEGYAIPQFNINNLEWTKFILEEAEKQKSPIILGVSEGAIKYMGGYNVVYSLVASLITDLGITIPVSLHLDHGTTLESCKKAVDAGFTSVMIDASKHDLETNIMITNQVCELDKKVSVEAEVGHIGGTEDNITADIAYAKVNDVAEMVSRTKIDLLAAALGSVHGLYKGEPKLDFDRMLQIKEMTKMPLVLHGGSGIPDEMIRKSISLGMAKVNFNTELQIVWYRAVKEFVINNQNYDPRKVISSGEKAIKEVVAQKIELLGSKGKAYE